MTTVDLDAWIQGDVGDLTNPAVIAELRRMWWREEAEEIAETMGITDQSLIAKIAAELEEWASV